MATTYALAHKPCSAPIGTKIKAGRAVTGADGTAYIVDGRAPQYPGTCAVCGQGVAKARLFDAVLLAS